MSEPNRNLAESTGTQGGVRPLGGVSVRDDEERRFSEIIVWIVQNRVLLLCGALLGGLLLGVYGFVKEPVYRVETVLAVVDQTNKDGASLGALSSRLGGAFGGAILGGFGAPIQENRAEFIALLSSRAFTEEFITDENLMPILLATRWWFFGNDDRTGTLFRAYRYFDKNVREVTESRTTGLVTLAIEWRDPQLAARWANLMVVRLNELARQRAITEARKSLEYLNHELTDTNVVEVRTAIYRLIEAEMSKIMLATVRKEYALRVVDPARAPDRDYYVRPKRALLVILGMGGGAMLGAMIALILAARREQRPSG